MKQKPITKTYRVKRAFTFNGTLYNRSDKPNFTAEQIAGLTRLHGTDLPVEEITAPAPVPAVAETNPAPAPAAPVAAAPARKPKGEAAAN